jgi:release factor glutamine methyltransferase
VRPSEVVRRAAGYLERHDVDSPVPTAEILLASVLGTSRVALYTREEGLTSAEARAFGRALCRRCVGTPIQHLTGEQGFRRLVVRVEPGVFVPRPETEVLVEHALGLLEGHTDACVADVGTGSGAIALAIKDELPGARVVATDRSRAAVELARRNAAMLALEIDVREGDLLSPWPELRGAVDLVVSNPPYVEPEDATGLPPEVLADPAGAVVGGLAVYPDLLGAAAAWLRPGGAVVVEIGERQGAAVARGAAARLDPP